MEFNRAKELVAEYFRSEKSQAMLYPTREFVEAFWTLYMFVDDLYASREFPEEETTGVDLEEREPTVITTQSVDHDAPVCSNCGCFIRDEFL